MCAEAHSLLRLRQLGLRSGATQRLHDICLDVAAHEIVAVIGCSGAGKSSLLQVLSGLATGSISGEIIWQGQALPPDRITALRGKHISLLPQGLADALNPHMRVLEVVIETLRLHQRLSQRQARTLAQQALLQGNVPTRLHRRYPRHLSGGEVQRVLWVLAALHQPQLLLLDEPTAALDQQAKAHLAGQLEQRKATSAMLIVSHDLAWLRGLADRIVVLDQGRIVEDSASEDFFSAPRHAVSRALLQAEQPLELAKPQRGELLLELHGLAHGFGGHCLFEHLDWRIYQGERWLLRGPSGSGKSTLARIIAGWLAVQQGSLQWSVPVTGCQAERVALIPQHAWSSFASRQRVADILSEPLRLQGIRESRQQLLQRLEAVRLPATEAFLQRYPSALSGGEQQRLALARAMSLMPRLLLADEPTSSLDRLSRQQFLRVLLELQQQHGFALIMLSHEDGMAQELQAQVRQIQAGQTLLP